MSSEKTLGAVYLGKGRCRFTVWAPLVQQVEVRITSPREKIFRLEKDERGCHQATIEGVEPGSLYLYRLGGEKERPDPASRFQPQGVHGPSQVVNPDFSWNDDCWFGLPLRDYIIYELHVGTFTPEGTFKAVIPHLQDLKNLGITAIELMPVGQFPGSRNWGYDSTYPFAVQNSYGGPDGLKHLVNACHQVGLAVVMDVVYNHLGPEGNYLADFGPYFTDRYRGPWGNPINYDGPHSDDVRRFFIENALYWVREFHMDGLRVDAVHGILDFSACPFLEDLAATVHEQAERLNRRVYLIAESDLNDTRIVRSRQLGGFGLDSQWNDDFHHALHTLLTKEDSGYYQDFGGLQHLVKAFRQGFVYSGDYSSYRKRRHGNSSRDLSAERFVVFSQNHDQVGNRAQSERLRALVSFEALKLAAGVVLLSPFIPLLFMGEEYGETAPFYYFISHSDPELIEAVRRGRRDEFASFRWQGEPPDPQDEATFFHSRLNHDLRCQGHHEVLYTFYRELIRLRRESPPLKVLDKERLEVTGLEQEKVLFWRRWREEQEAAAVFHFGKQKQSLSLPLPEGHWQKLLDSADTNWSGPGSTVTPNVVSTGKVSLSLPPESCVVFIRE
ncbi:MAG: malto-oligosyltrehalose trehalohydrolase [Deltaproteobacteria bacterium]|nr:MAG: malto-oligosyltrehalose trehalohydrolase [Deltaproteobacteria bacterium]